MRKFLREIAAAALTAVCFGCVGTPPKPEPKPNELAGSVWHPAEPRQGAYIEFTPDGRAVGSSGKNRFFAPVSFAAGKRIRIAPVAYTMVNGRLDEWEIRFFQALDNTRGYVFDGDTLSLYSEERLKLLEFKMLLPPKK